MNDEKWPEVLGLNLQTLQVKDLTNLEKIDSGSAPTGETYNLYSGPIKHRSFDQITLKVWDHAAGFPNYILLTNEYSDDLMDIALHLNHTFGEAEMLEEEHFIWQHKHMYMVLSLEEDMQLEIFMDRQTELESANIQALFPAYSNSIPGEL